MPDLTDHDLLNDLHTAIIGINGSPSIVSKLNDLDEKIDRHISKSEDEFDDLHKKSNRTRNMLLSLVGVLSGSGVITAGSIWGFG